MTYPIEKGLEEIIKEISIIKKEIIEEVSKGEYDKLEIVNKIKNIFFIQKDLKESKLEKIYDDGIIPYVFFDVLNCFFRPNSPQKRPAGSNFKLLVDKKYNEVFRRKFSNTVGGERIRKAYLNQDSIIPNGTPNKLEKFVLDLVKKADRYDELFSDDSDYFLRENFPDEAYSYSINSRIYNIFRERNIEMIKIMNDSSTTDSEKRSSLDIIGKQFEDNISNLFRFAEDLEQLITKSKKDDYETIKDIEIANLDVDNHEVLSPLGKKGGLSNAFLVKRLTEQESSSCRVYVLLVPKEKPDEFNESAKRMYNEIGQTRLFERNIKILEELNIKNNLGNIIPTIPSDVKSKYMGRQAKCIKYSYAEEQIEIDKIDSSEIYFKGMLNLTDALSKIHELGIIHNDISPNNILVNGETGELRIIDFALSSSERLGLKPFTYGSVRFSSPELRKNEKLTPASDIWSLGAILYYRLTGFHPFGSEDEIKKYMEKEEKEKYRKAIHEKVCSENYSGKEIFFNNTISDNIQKIILKCLAYNPKDRYQSAIELKEDLEKIKDEFLVLQLPPQPPLPQTPILSLLENYKEEPNEEKGV